MVDNSLEQRVFAIEQMLQDYATARDLERVEHALGEQIVQLRLEMRGELSALRQEISAGDEETRRSLREEIRAVDQELRGVIEGRTAEILAVVSAGNEENRRLMRVLHEDVIARIDTIRRG